MCEKRMRILGGLLLMLLWCGDPAGEGPGITPCGFRVVPESVGERLYTRVMVQEAGKPERLLRTRFMRLCGQELSWVTRRTQGVRVLSGAGF